MLDPGVSRPPCTSVCGGRARASPCTRSYMFMSSTTSLVAGTISLKADIGVIYFRFYELSMLYTPDKGLLCGKSGIFDRRSSIHRHGICPLCGAPHTTTNDPVYFPNVISCLLVFGNSRSPHSEEESAEMEQIHKKKKYEIELIRQFFVFFVLFFRQEC